MFQMLYIQSIKAETEIRQNFLKRWINQSKVKMDKIITPPGGYDIFKMLLLIMASNSLHLISIGTLAGQ